MGRFTDLTTGRFADLAKPISLTYLDYAKQYGFDPNHPIEDYDYRGAFEAGTIPKRWQDLPEADRREDMAQGRNIPPNAWMWPDEFKGTKHRFLPKTEQTRRFADLAQSPKASFLQAAPEPSWWESIKEQVLFPAKEPVLFEPLSTYAGRWTEPTIEEKYIHRPLTFLPRVGFKAIGELLDRAKRIIGGTIEAPGTAISKRNISELKTFVESTTEGLKSAIRKPGAKPTAPTPGELFAGPDWYEEIAKGEKAPPWLAPMMDLSVDTILLLGKPAYSQWKAGRLAKIAAAKPITEAARLKPTGVVKEVAPSGPGVPPGTSPVPIKEIAAPFARGISPKPLVEKPIQKLTRLITSAERVEKAQRGLRHKEMQKRVARYAGTLERETGERAFFKAKGALKGQLPTAEFTPPRMEMVPAEINSLVEQLRVSNKLLPLQKGNAFEGLQQLFAGQIPQRNKLLLLEREFGPELIRAVLGKRPFSAKAMENIVDIANLPRTFLTAYDLSASLRQNYISGIRHPIKWSKAFGAQIKALASEKNALAIEQSIRDSKYYSLAVQHKLYLPDVKSAAVGLGARPEEFMSRFARVIPGVKASERAFITMGNKMRFELFSKYAQMWEGTGKTAGDYAGLAKYLNAVTGRGSLGAFEKSGAALNALLFSPRYLASRIQTVGAVGQLIPGIGSTAVGKIAAGDLAAFAGVNLSVLATAKFIWGDDVDVEIDPRSSDFGKLRIGNSRFDLWSGYQPLMRYTAQAITGQQKAAMTGKVSEAPRMDILGRFVRSKLAPVPSFIVDLKTGSTFVGDEMTAAGLRKLPPENLAFQRFFPLAGQDIWDAVKYQGGEAAWLTVPAATLGIGTGTWELSGFKKLALQQDELAHKYYGDKWDNLGPVAQRFIRNLNPELEILKKEAQYERKGFSFLQQAMGRQLKAGRQVEANLPRELQGEMERLKVSVGVLSQTLGAWRMSDERYEEYQDLITEQIAKEAGIVGSESYLKTSDKFKRRRLEALVERAKKRARGQIKRGAVREDTKKRKSLFK